MVRTSLLYTYVTLFLLQQPQQGLIDDVVRVVETEKMQKGDMQQASQSIGGGANDAFLMLES